MEEFLKQIPIWMLLIKSGETILKTLGILLNVLTILLIFKSKKLYPENNMYLISLSVSDILHLVITTGAVLIVSRESPMELITSFPQCIYLDTLYDLFSTISILTIMTMSFERFMAVVYPFVYLKVTLHGKKLRIMFILCLWVLPCAFILSRNIYILITSSSKPGIPRDGVDQIFSEMSTLPNAFTRLTSQNTSILASSLSTDPMVVNESIEISWNGHLQNATSPSVLSSQDLEINSTIQNITEKLNADECLYGKTESVIFTIVLFFIPLLLLLCFYTKVICCILAAKKITDRTDIDNKTKSIIKMSVTICVAFFICWLPYRLDTMFTAYSGFDYLPLSNEERILVVFTLANLSCVINPIILYIIFPNWRAGVKELLSHILPKRNKRQKEPGNNIIQI